MREARDANVPNFKDKRSIFLPRKKRGGGCSGSTTAAAAAIYLVFVVYDRESMGPRLLSLPLRRREEVGTSDLRLALLKGS
jgi:hypothetical protein